MMDELPKQPGWYWVTEKGYYGSRKPFVVQVDSLADGLVVWRSGYEVPEQDLSAFNWLEQIPQKVLEG